MNHLKRHMCGWSTNTLAVSPSATCALGLPSTQVGSPSAQGWADRAPGDCGL